MPFCLWITAGLKSRNPRLTFKSIIVQFLIFFTISFQTSIIDQDFKELRIESQPPLSTQQLHIVTNLLRPIYDILIHTTRQNSTRSRREQRPIVQAVLNDRQEHLFVFSRKQQIATRMFGRHVAWLLTINDCQGRTVRSFKRKTSKRTDDWPRRARLEILYHAQESLVSCIMKSGNGKNWKQRHVPKYGIQLKQRNLFLETKRNITLRRNYFPRRYRRFGDILQ